MTELLATVLTPPALVAALTSGFIFGYLVLAEVIRSTRWGRASASANAFAKLVAILATAFGLSFYLSQIVAAYFDGDAQWPRALARALLLLPYGLAAGAGVRVSLWRRSHL